MLQEMLYSLVWLLLKTILGLLLAYFLVICFFHLRAIHRLNFYEKQGAVVFPGARRFFFGNNLDMIDYSKMRARKDPICGPNQWLVFEHFPRVMGLPKDKLFQADEYPILACNFQSLNSLWVSSSRPLAV